MVYMCNRGFWLRRCQKRQIDQRMWWFIFLPFSRKKASREFLHPCHENVLLYLVYDIHISGSIKRFYGNQSSRDCFKLFSIDNSRPSSVLIGAKNIVYNLSLPIWKKTSIRYRQSFIIFVSISIWHGAFSFFGQRVQFTAPRIGCPCVCCCDME